MRPSDFRRAPIALNRLFITGALTAKIDTIWYAIRKTRKRACDVTYSLALRPYRGESYLDGSPNRQDTAGDSHAHDEKSKGKKEHDPSFAVDFSQLKYSTMLSSKLTAKD